MSVAKWISCGWDRNTATGRAIKTEVGDESILIKIKLLNAFSNTNQTQTNHDNHTENV